MITTLALLPAAPVLPRVNAQGTSALYVADAFGNIAFAGNPGDSFTVSVFISNVENLVGYDVILRYNHFALTATNVVFDTNVDHSVNTVFCMDDIFTPHIPCRDSQVSAQIFQDATGTIRSARSLKSGVTMNVDSNTGDLPALVVTFMSKVRESAVIHIATDEECACNGLAVIMGGQSVGIPHTTADATFFTEPNILFHSWNATISQSQKTLFLDRGETSVTLVSKLKLSSKETVPGFAFVVFDVLDPQGGDTPVVSNTVVLVPGDIKTVTGAYTFSSDCSVSCGTYLILVTLWRGSVPEAIVAFQQSTGQHFQVLPSGS